MQLLRNLIGFGLFSLAHGAVEAHNWMRNHPLRSDTMAMTVWVDGQTVCQGIESVAYASNDTKFCLLNHDGKGKGCSEGYSYCTTGNGNVAWLEYFENSELVYRMDLEAKQSKRWQPELACGFINDPKDEERPIYCWFTDNCMSSGSQSKCRFCDTDYCDGREDFNPPKEFPYPKKFRAMFVGDSITQGAHSDVTWRYRIWEWLKDSEEYDMDFVGPWEGTFPILDSSSALPEPPPKQGESASDDRPTQGGAYHKSVPSNFPDRHYARWGRQAAQSKGDIAKQVKEYQPTHLLILLGFNDIGWFVNDAPGMVSDLSELVYEAQTAKNDVQILLGNIPHRSRIDWRKDLIEKTDEANRLIRENIARWTRFDSVVKMVDVESFYNCAPEKCPSAVSSIVPSPLIKYDGLHPNMWGEIEIAKAFMQVLKDQFRFDRPIVRDNQKLDPPPSHPTASTPPNFKVKASDIGLSLSWDAVWGARSYDVRTRLQGQPWPEVYYPASTNAYHSAWVLEDQTWEAQVRTIMSDDIKSSWTSTGSAKMDPKTLKGPSHIVTTPADGGIYVHWDERSGATSYAVVVYNTESDEYLTKIGTTRTSIQIDDVTYNGLYIIGVESWNAIGGGMVAVARHVRPGVGQPAPPSSFALKKIDDTTVQLDWEGHKSAAGYRVWIRDKLNNGEWKSEEYGTTIETTYQIFFMFPGVWHYEFQVSSYNGDLESARTAIRSIPNPS